MTFWYFPTQSPFFCSHQGSICSPACLRQREQRKVRKQWQVNHVVVGHASRVQATYPHFSSFRIENPVLFFNSFHEQSSWKELQRTFDIVHDLCGRMCARKNPSSKGSLQAIGDTGSCDCAVLWTSTAS